MKPDRISDAISQMDEDLIEEYFETKQKRKRKNRRRVWKLAGCVAAACLVLLIGLPWYLAGRIASEYKMFDKFTPGSSGNPSNMENPGGSEQPGNHIDANTSETEEKVPGHDGMDESESMSGTEDSETETDDSEDTKAKR